MKKAEENFQQVCQKLYFCIFMLPGCAATMAAAQYRESLLEDDRRADAATVLADDILKFYTVRPK